MAGRTLHILLVDDCRTLRRVIEGLLKQLGLPNIDEAADGRIALDMLNEKKYDLVISDWNMEPMTGLDLLKQVRANTSLKDIPFIMLTAENKTENVVAAKQAGVNDYIVKPFNADTLKQKLTSVIGTF